MHNKLLLLNSKHIVEINVPLKEQHGEEQFSDGDYKRWLVIQASKPFYNNKTRLFLCAPLMKWKANIHGRPHASEYFPKIEPTEDNKFNENEPRCADIFMLRSFDLLARSARYIGFVDDTAMKKVHGAIKLHMGYSSLVSSS
jgi:hypothetical protein